MAIELTQYRGEISIQQVIAEIREFSGRPFFLQFVRATGNRKGSIKTVSKALYGKPRQPLKTLEESVKDWDQEERNARKKPLHTDKGTLPMSNYETGEYFTPLIATIISYNGFKVIH